ncbi:flagellar hook-basal body complex protein FliE [Deltaproteobacteria bacterium TL4]
MKLPPSQFSPIQKIAKEAVKAVQKPNFNDTSRNIGQTFEQLLQAVNHQQLTAETKQTEFLTTSKKDIHGTMIALEKADLSLQLMLQVRNKLMAAYEEIMRMQV